MDDQNIPIDIHTTKLLDWLISRRHIPKDWQNRVIKVREKINNAIQDMPVHDGIVKLVSGQHINYFHCLKIVDILKETEKDSKNIFGRYGSQRMKDWQDVIADYQKDNIYLAEVAVMLIRNVSYEIPSMKKQVHKLEQLQAENEKKIKDCNKSEAVSQKEFKVACGQLGIKGEKVKSELLDLLNELPQLYEETAEKITIVRSAIELYAAFTKYLSGQDIDCINLPILSYLIEKGNTTAYEFVYGEKPLRIEEPQKATMEEVDKDDVNVIDFGDSDNIDFGDNGAEVDFGGETKEIDFGDQIVLETPKSAEQIICSTDSSNDGSFEIISYDDLNPDLEIVLDESGIVVEKSGEDGGIARGEEALTILDHPKYREQIINDLSELEAFVKMRLFEMSHESDVLSMSQMQDAPTTLQMQTLESVTALADSVNVALSCLTNKRIQHLHNIKHSERYLDLLTASLNQKLTLGDRMRATKKVLEDKTAQTADEIRKLVPVIKLLFERSKQMQREIQDDISKKYNGRTVNLVGGVNVLTV
ncbi:hypothetical protein HUJ04_003940 [Dendroctonus ponderosae]